MLPGKSLGFHPAGHPCMWLKYHSSFLQTWYLRVLLSLIFLLTVAGLGSCFSSIPGRQSSGARQVQSGQSLTDCLRACLSEVCAGVDFVQMTTTECWLYDDPQKLKDKYDNPAITQYINNCNVSFPTTTPSTTTSTTTTTTTKALPTTTSITTTTTGKVHVAEV